MSAEKPTKSGLVSLTCSNTNLGGYVYPHIDYLKTLSLERRGENVLSKVMNVTLRRG